MDTAHCRKCDKTKSVSEFYPHKTAKSGRRSECKECTKAAVRASVDPEVNRKRVREYRQSNREAVNAKNRAYAKANPEKAKLWRLRGKLAYMYGITLDEANAMRERQGGLCAVYGCNRPGTDIDHCHATGKVRGILCSGCNKALGLLGDSVARIEGLAEYVEMST